MLFDLPTFPDAALALERAAVGTFFAISGYHKLFNTTRHATMKDTLVACGVPYVEFNCWFVPACEFGFGMLLTVGAASYIAAFNLLIICGVAILTDGVRRVREYKPIDAADCVDDVLYLPEVLYAVLLLTTLLAGPGKWSVDTFFKG